MHPHSFKSVALILFATSIFVGGCSTVNPARTQAGNNLSNFKTVYVVTHGGSSVDMDTHLQNTLLDRGLKVSAGSENAKPINVDMYAIYTDTWRWDLTMYLKSLQIQFYETKNGTLIASGSFSNGILHSWPDAGKKVAEVVATMYGEKRPE